MRFVFSFHHSFTCVLPFPPALRNFLCIATFIPAATVSVYTSAFNVQQSCSCYRYVSGNAEVKRTTAILHSCLFLERLMALTSIAVFNFAKFWISWPYCGIMYVSWQDGEAALSNWCLRTTVWRRVRILGPGRQPGGALLLDDLHAGNNHANWDTIPP
jgi:hypothetical protein